MESVFMHMEQHLRMKNNFNKRFKKGIQVTFLEKALSPSEEKIRNQKIVEAFKNVLTGILGREPTEEELFGHVKLDIKKGKRKVTWSSAKYPRDLAEGSVIVLVILDR